MAERTCHEMVIELLKRLFCMKCFFCTFSLVFKIFPNYILYLMGAQWLSGRVLDSRPKGRGFVPHRRQCVVVSEDSI